MFSVLDHLEMQVIVFLDKTFVFFLQWHHTLTIETGFIGDDSVFIFELLEGLGGLQNFIQQAFHQS